MDAGSPDAARHFTYWLRTMQNFVSTLPADVNKLQVLINYIGFRAYPIVEDSTTYDAAIAALKAAYVKQKNEVYARHLLAVRRQQPEETIDDFLQALKTLAKDGNYTAVTAQKHQEEAIRDSFITGLKSNAIRQRLLENQKLDLNAAYDQARALDAAQQNAVSYTNQTPQYQASAAMSGIPTDTSCNQTKFNQYQNKPPTSGMPNRSYSHPQQKKYEQPSSGSTSQSNQSNRCYFCLRPKHPRERCPARYVTCYNCNIQGHFSKACHSNPSQSSASLQYDPPMLCSLNYKPTVALVSQQVFSED